MRVADAIKNLMELNSEDEIMIQWFTKEHAEYTNEGSVSKDQWELAVRLFDKNPPDHDDFGIHYCVNEAGERLAS
jgi:hypothetical protein